MLRVLLGQYAVFTINIMHFFVITKTAPGRHAPIIVKIKVICRNGPITKPLQRLKSNYIYLSTGSFSHSMKLSTKNKNNGEST